MREARITLSRAALAHNLAVVRRTAPHSRVLSMVKADAYGHGLAFAVAALQDTDAFGVAFMQEARQVRALTAHPIMVMEGAFSLAEWQESALLGVQCVIHHAQQVQWALESPIAGATVWLKLNAGMNRLGLAPAELICAAQQLRQVGYQLVLTMHFANADEPDHPLNAQQIAVFEQVKAQLDPIDYSVCNSAALLQWPQRHGAWVRPGIMLYGSSPFADRSAGSLELHAVMQVESSLMAIHHLPVGQAVGYGSRWVTSRPSTIGVVAMGYGDGYPRVVDERAMIDIAGQLVPVVGRVSMDMLMVDLTDLPIPAVLHQRVTLWGDQPSVDQIAASANTLGYELLCRMTQRPARVLAD